MMFYTLLAVAIITSLSAVFVWRVVNRPLKILGNEADRLATGRLGHQIQVRSHDEIADGALVHHCEPATEGRT